MKHALVTPIYKKGDGEDPCNYRPISITPALSKIFEKVLRKQMNEYLEENRSLRETQFGFRKRFSTTDALRYATETTRKNLDDVENVAAAFLDLSKAFDSISHEILLNKLKQYNFDLMSISMIRSFLSERYQKVTLPNCHSDWVKLYQGVPRGTVLGLLLFNIYVNDMQHEVQNDCNLCNTQMIPWCSNQIVISTKQ